MDTDIVTALVQEGGVAIAALVTVVGVLGWMWKNHIRPMIRDLAETQEKARLLEAEERSRLLSLLLNERDRSTAAMREVVDTRMAAVESGQALTQAKMDSVDLKLATSVALLEELVREIREPNRRN